MSLEGRTVAGSQLHARRWGHMEPGERNSKSMGRDPCLLPAPGTSATASPGSAGTGLGALSCPKCHQSQGPNHPDGADSALMYLLHHGGTFQAAPTASATCSISWPRARGDEVTKALQIHCTGAGGCWHCWKVRRGSRMDGDGAGKLTWLVLLAGGEERPEAAAVLGGNRICFNKLHKKGL